MQYQREKKIAIVLIILGIILFSIGCISLVLILTGFWRTTFAFVLWVVGWFFGATLFFSGLSKLIDIPRKDEIR